METKSRAGTFLVVGLVVAALVAGAITLTRYYSGEGDGEPEPPPDTAAPGTPTIGSVTHEDWNGSITDRYPQIANGSFRDRGWVLEGRRGEIAPGVHKLVLEFLLEAAGGDGRLESATTEVLPSDDVLLVEEFDTGDGSARILFGAVLDSIQSVVAELDDGSTHGALIFTGYRDRSTITAQYYVLFLPPGSDGYLIARDPDGTVWEREPIGDAPEAGRSTRPLGTKDG